MLQWIKAVDFVFYCLIFLTLSLQYADLGDKPRLAHRRKKYRPMPRKNGNKITADTTKKSFFVV